MRRVTVAVAVLAFAAAMPLWAQPVTPAETPPTISVTATMVTQIAPDVVVWDIRLTNRAATLKEAKAAADAATGRILGVTKELNATSADIRTSQLSAHREGGRDFWGNEVTKGWTICRSITIKQNDLARFDDFFMRLVDSTDVDVNYRFESSRYHELRKETRIRAASAAKEKAQAMVEAVGGTLGPPISVVEGVWANATPGFGGYGGRIIDTKSNGSITVDWPGTASAGAPADADNVTDAPAPGMTEIRETVSVTFKLQ